MKLQSLAIMFIILILPISIILASYTQSTVKTIGLEATYDSKLNDATYDALKSYQLNSLNSDTSIYVNAKLRDIKASANTFFNSIATNFSNLGYTTTTIKNYVPALVYTMYDGYYIYSPYINTWDQETSDKVQDVESPSFTEGQILYNIKPYVSYSCRYKKDNEFDVVITYSLDNYIQIQGEVGLESNPKTISVAGYLIQPGATNANGDRYKGIDIKPESNVIIEKVRVLDYNNNEIYEELPCRKINGTKYYWDKNGTILSETDKKMTNVFSIVNGKAIPQSVLLESDSAGLYSIRENNNAQL